jgi:predicted ATPase with chaperone activity
MTALLSILGFLPSFVYPEFPPIPTRSTEPSAEALLRAAMKKLNLSARAYHRVLKVSRTIADLAESDILRTEHVAEAVQYRARTLLG